MSDADTLVCVLAKAPQPGNVKTRLAPAVGEEGAARLARAFLEDTVTALRSLTWARPVLVLSGAGGGALGESLGVPVWPQGTGDLGARLRRALCRGLCEAPLSIAVGTDSPGLPMALMHGARRALNNVDAVIGPSDDGGFYLLGVRRLRPRLLARLPWSRSDTFRRTVDRLDASGLTTAVLPPWFDVDEPADLARLRVLLDAGQIRADATARVLEELAA